MTYHHLNLSNATANLIANGLHASLVSKLRQEVLKTATSAIDTYIWVTRERLETLEDHQELLSAFRNGSVWENLGSLYGADSDHQRLKLSHAVEAYLEAAAMFEAVSGETSEVITEDIV